MAPPGVNLLLTGILIAGFGFYFAWGVMQMARKSVPAGHRLRRRPALEIAVALSGTMLLLGALQAWQYRSWQPVWVLGAISAVTLLVIILYLPPK
jgi:CDP-diglyceride synthetase